MSTKLIPVSREKRRILRSLGSRKIRHRRGLCLVEGERALVEAGRSGFLEYIVSREDKSDSVFIKEETEAIRNAPIFLGDEVLFREVSDVVSQQGWLGVARIPTSPGMSDVLHGEKKVLLYFDAVQDPGNAGALIRSAWALGAAGVLMGPGSVDPFGPKAVRASAGGVFHLPCYEGVGEEDLRPLKESGFVVYLADKGGAPYRNVDFAPRSILAVGNEGQGLSPWISGQGEALSVPMQEGVDSLNVVVAGSLILAAMLGEPLP
jgi:TrmH family RNA methyltransferase